MAPTDVYLSVALKVAKANLLNALADLANSESRTRGFLVREINKGFPASVDQFHSLELDIEAYRDAAIRYNEIRRIIEDTKDRLVRATDFDPKVPEGLVDY